VGSPHKAKKHKDDTFKFTNAAVFNMLEDTVLSEDRPIIVLQNSQYEL
jgi:hypothetical protein